VIASWSLISRRLPGAIGESAVQDGRDASTASGPGLGLTLAVDFAKYPDGNPVFAIDVALDEIGAGARLAGDAVDGLAAALDGGDLRAGGQGDGAGLKQLEGLLFAGGELAINLKGIGVWCFANRTSKTATSAFRAGILLVAHWEVLSPAWWLAPPVSPCRGRLVGGGLGDRLLAVLGQQLFCQRFRLILGAPFGLITKRGLS
jgi:hypothetical protein